MAQARADASRDLPRAPGTRIVRTKDQPAWADGFQFLEDAKRVYQEERQRGYAEGKEEGAREAAQLVAETALKVDRYVASLDKQIAALTLDIVRRVLGRFENADLVAHVAATAIADFRRDKTLKVVVNPAVAERVRGFLAKHLPRPEITLTVEADASLGPTDCLISSESTVVNASIETQLEAIGRVLGLAQGMPTP
jgi:type III secretion protein L